MIPVTQTQPADAQLSDACGERVLFPAGAGRRPMT